MVALAAVAAMPPRLTAVIRNVFNRIEQPREQLHSINRIGLGSRQPATARLGGLRARTGPSATAGSDSPPTRIYGINARQKRSALIAREACRVKVTGGKPFM